VGQRVFEGIKVADFSWSIVGPLMAKCLAEHGAEVVHIESTIHPDSLRTFRPYKDDVPGLNRAPVAAIWNNDKYGVTLNLDNPRGIEVAKRIVAWADIVLESFTPGMMARWGLSYEELREIKPDIIMISTCNQGQTGPHAQTPGYGLHLAALCGFDHLLGWPDRDPVLLSIAYTDPIAPHFGAAALIAALDYRRRTGKGQYLDLAQYEVGLQFIAPLILDYAVNGRVANRLGNRCPYAAPHGAYPCLGDDRWCNIAVFTDEEWEAFCKVMGNPDWAKEPRFSTLQGRKANEDDLDRLVGEWTSNFTAEQLMAMLQAIGVSAGVVQTIEDIYQDPQLKHRHCFWELEHREMGKHYYEAPAFKLSKTPAMLRRGGPCLGEHNEYFYTKILGIPDEEFIELLKEGVFE